MIKLSQFKSFAQLTRSISNPRFGRFYSRQYISPKYNKSILNWANHQSQSIFQPKRTMTTHPFLLEYEDITEEESQELDPQYQLINKFTKHTKSLGTKVPFTVNTYRMNLKVAMKYIALGLSSPPTQLVKDFTLPVLSHTVNVRLYDPKNNKVPGPETLPCIVFMHGGGWSAGDLDGFDLFSKMLAHITQSVVISVNYRLAPQHKFPGPLDDCYEVVKYIASKPDEFNIDPERIMIAGTSSGANLALGVCQLIHYWGGPKLIGQLLIGPPLDTNCDTPTFKQYGNKHLTLPGDLVKFFWRQYLYFDKDKENPLACPGLLKDLSTLPNTYLLYSEIDPLRYENQVFASRLKDAGVLKYERMIKGVPHGADMNFQYNVMRKTWVDIAPYLRECVGVKETPDMSIFDTWQQEVDIKIDAMITKYNQGNK